MNCRRKTTEYPPTAPTPNTIKLKVINIFRYFFLVLLTNVKGQFMFLSNEIDMYYLYKRYP